MYPLRSLPELLNRAATVDDIVSTAQYCIRSRLGRRAMVLVSENEGRPEFWDSWDTGAPRCPSAPTTRWSRACRRSPARGTLWAPKRRSLAMAGPEQAAHGQRSAQVRPGAAGTGSTRKAGPVDLSDRAEADGPSRAVHPGNMKIDGGCPPASARRRSPQRSSGSQTADAAALGRRPASRAAPWRTSGRSASRTVPAESGTVRTKTRGCAVQGAALAAVARGADQISATATPWWSLKGTQGARPAGARRDLVCGGPPG